MAAKRANLSLAMWKVAIATFLLGLGTPAGAEEPKGFADFPWGTVPEVLREKLLTKRCQSYVHYSRETRSAYCRAYLVEGLNVSQLRFDFEPDDSLAGYYMLVARHSYPTLRRLTLERFGPPTAKSSFFGFNEQLFWDWEGTRALLIQRCGPETSCLEVKTLPLVKKREQEIARQRRELQQSF